MELTKQQQAVVNAELSDLLISAAAGSGKTMVLVERISSRIIKRELDVRKVLVMTFTNAAAAHMSNKLEKALLSALNDATDPSERKYISEQISCLPIAHISTIHSFCLDVIRNFESELKLDSGEVLFDPGIKILDAANGSILLDEAINEIFERIYTLCHRVLVLNEEAGSNPVSREIGNPEEEDFLFSLMDGSVSVKQWCEEFLRMTFSLSSSRDDTVVKDTVRSIHSSLRSLPEYQKHVQKIIEEKQIEASDFSQSTVAQKYLEDLRGAVMRATSAVSEIEDELDSIVFVKDKKKNREYADLVLEWFRFVKDLSSICKRTFSWDDIVEASGHAPAGKWPGLPGPSSEDEAKKRFFGALDPVFEVMYVLTGKLPKKDFNRRFSGLGKYVFGKTAPEYQEESAFMLPVISRLYETILLSDSLYLQKKRKENSIDFSDQEQFALFLLSVPEIRDHYRSQFDEIYIDEYQDNSRIQDAIVSKFSRGNVFFVGDIKQSIYRFRYARPDMFSARSDRYARGDGGKLLTLNGNFRSRPSVLAFVNDLFSQILTRESGDIEYDASARLEPTRSCFEDENECKASVQVLLIDATGQSPSEDEVSDSQEPVQTGNLIAEEEMDIKKSDREALCVLSRIQAIRKKEACAWSDFAVLTRTNREANRIRNILSQAGVPSQGPTESSIFSQRELLLMQNLIRLIDNARQDIPLAAVMRSPFPAASFSPEEMLSISLYEDKVMPRLASFHEKVNRFAEDGFEPLRGKVNRLLDFITRFRTQSMYLKISELIEKIYIETGFMDYLSGRDNGQERVAALEKFRDWANQFESHRRGGLYQFVRYIEEIESNERSVEDFEISEQLRDAVRCMSIHKSKGLEFKNVFICGIANPFSGPSENGTLIVNDRMGVGMDYVNTDAGYKYPTPCKILMADSERRESLSEQLRLFYVAATRAEERLCMIGTFSRKKNGAISGHEETLQDALTASEEQIPSRMVRSSKSYLDFILLGLARNPHVSLDGLLGSETSSGAVPERTMPQLRADITFTIEKAADADWTVLRPASVDELIPCATPDEDQTMTAPLSEEKKARFSLQISGKYPYENLVRMPAKTTVSEMKRRRLPLEDGDAETPAIPAVTTDQVETRRPLNLLLRPREIEKGPASGLSPSETGILLHSVFQYIDFPALPPHPEANDIINEIDKLIRFKMIRDDQLKYVLPFAGVIAKFAASDLCGRMIRAERKSGKGPFREMPFSITVPVSGSDICLIQGMVDCWFIEDEKAVLVDYKSDRIAGDLATKEKVLRERYGTQLDYYARAIEAASKLEVKEKRIWLIPEAISFVL